MRVLCVTRIFPNRVETTMGPYNKKQLSALRDLGHEVQVVNPIPWFPGAEMFRGRTRAGVSSEIPYDDVIANVHVKHPRFLHVPRLSIVHAPLYALGSLGTVAELAKKFDVILSPFAYPDGVASVILGGILNLPVVIKLHGGDINVAARMPQIRGWVQWAFRRVAGVIAVSHPLAKAAHELGVPWSKISVVEDGVDANIFSIRDLRQAKRKVGLDPDRRHIVFVGRLERRKGIFELMESFDRLMPTHREVDLVLVGAGEDFAAVKKWAAPLGGRVVLAGEVGVDEVSDYYAASDITTLPSHAEGTPNSLIEAIACGRPVVASAVGGIPDMIASSKMGELVPPKDIAALTDAFDRALRTTYIPEEIVRLSGRGTWHDSARCLAEALQAASQPR